MKSIRVHFIALESSGRRWIESICGSHPMIRASGTSYPAFVGNERQYQPVNFMAFDILAVVVRDMTCHRRSVESKGYEAGNQPGEFNDAQSVQWISTIVERARRIGKRIVWCDYEAAVIYRQTYFDAIFAALGVTARVVDTEFKDENEKYFNHESRLLH